MIVHELNIQELEHPSRHLTDNYKKDENSNNYKLLDLGHQEHTEIMQNLRLIELWRDIDNAEGFTLDKIGKNVLELREGRADPEYRKAIKIKIRGNLSAGTVEDFNIIGAILFGDSFEGVTETWQLEQYAFEPAGIVLFIKDMTIQQTEEFHYFRNILESIKAGGVRLFWNITQRHNRDDISAVVAGIAKHTVKHTATPVARTNIICHTVDATSVISAGKAVHAVKHTASPVENTLVDMYLEIDGGDIVSGVVDIDENIQHGFLEIITEGV
jgi:hypothetical protein